MITTCATSFRTRLCLGTPRMTAAAAALAVLVSLASGCASPDRPGPIQEFDDLANRALKEDAKYVRARLAPSLLDQAKAEGCDVASDAYVREWMQRLQVCRANRWRISTDPHKGTIEASAVQPGQVQQMCFDLVFDSRVGWQIAGGAYEVRPLTQPQQQEQPQPQ